MEGALVGPLTRPPFAPWCVFSPMKTRPKDNGKKHRVIVDLSFPHGGVNKYIEKSKVDGVEVTHTLPTIQDAIRFMHSCKSDVTHMAAVDVSRAYRNFRICPADWPLMAIQYKNMAYLDMALPFVTRSSSYTMQQVAKFIIRALESRGAAALMYLDDLFIVAGSEQVAQSHYEGALELLTGRGLPIAQEKLQPPARELVWLGININLATNIISIPEHKFQEIRANIMISATKSSLKIKGGQSLIGSINHLSKAVPSARLFMGRILQAL